MPRFIDDHRTLSEFAYLAKTCGNVPPNSQQGTVGVLDWHQTTGLNNNIHPEIRHIEVTSLFNEHEPALRVIFAPLDTPSADTIDTLMALIDHYSIPPEFVTARLHSVTQAYGRRELSGNRHASWFHVLCKNISVQVDSGGVHRIVDPRRNFQTISQSEGTWIRQAFFLSWGPGRNVDTNTTLICFGAHSALEERFACLSARLSWTECLQSPFTLVVILLDELFQVLDNQVWAVSDVFSAIEMSILGNVEAWDSSTQFDFVGLHNISKHITYLVESANALICTAEDMHLHSTDVSGVVRSSFTDQTAIEIGSRKRLLHSISLRLGSLERRMQNIINLAFNVVTQQDSKVVQRDSYSMKTIAAVTLFFIPISTIATIFGSQFFQFDPSRSKSDFTISGSFWLLWAIAIPVTILVVCLWYFYYRWSVKMLNLGRNKRKISSNWF